MKKRKMANISESQSQTKTEPRISFVKDIQLMMFGLGDTSKPLRSTAELIEKIVIDQLYRIMCQADVIAGLRGSDVVAPEDIIFLMRKNIPALKRLLNYLSIKDEKRTLNRAVSETEEKDTEEQLLNELETRPPRIWNHSRKLYCLDFIKKYLNIDPALLEAVEDEVKETRHIRANSRSIRLTLSEYKDYSVARSVSFCSATQMSSPKFLIWLQTNGIKFKITNAITELLVYFAKESVACLVDMALTLREEKSFSLIDCYQTRKEPTPITTSEIIEVIRCCTFRHIQPYATFSRDLNNTATRKIIAI